MALLSVADAHQVSRPLADERPYSSRMLISNGKLREMAAARVNANAGSVVFFNELTARQRTVLTDVLGCPVFSRSDLQRPGDSSHRPEERSAAPDQPAADNGPCQREC